MWGKSSFLVHRSPSFQSTYLKNLCFSLFGLFNKDVNNNLPRKDELFEVLQIQAYPTWYHQMIGV